LKKFGRNRLYFTSNIIYSHVSLYAKCIRGELLRTEKRTEKKKVNTLPFYFLIFHLIWIL